MTLRLRVLIATGIAVLCGLTIAIAVTYVLVTRSQTTQVDETLRRAHAPIEQLASGRPDGWSVIPQVAPGLYVAILDQSGAAAFTSAAQAPGDEPVTVAIADIDLRRGNRTVQASDGHDMRLRIDPLRDGSTLVVGDSLHEVSETQERLLVALLGASAFALAVVLAISWWLVQLGLRPLRAVEASAAAITDRDLGDQRVPGADQPTEVGSLARALNAMLDRLDGARAEREETMEELRASEARMRQFVADASHELRTPTAAAAAYAELFEQGAKDRPADLERSMTGIRTETARMSELVDDLLLLARLDEHRPLAHESVDLTELLITALDAARAVEPNRHFRVHIGDVITVDGDAARLRQVLDNLLANVRTHTPITAACDVTLTTDGDDAVVLIGDAGPGVTDAQLVQLGNRFYRAEESRVRTRGGNGLGLSIAAAIVAAHGGSLTPTHNTPRGLLLTVRLPLQVQVQDAT